MECVGGMSYRVEARNLSKTYRVGKVGVPALCDVNLRVPSGDFVVIMGPSGCGKSTMLHILGGLLEPTAGDVLIDGENIAACPDRRRTEVRRKKIGFIFQKFNLFPTISAFANIELARQIHGDSDMGAGDLAAILEMLGLADKMHHKPIELSGGEQQRVAIARAVVNRPAIILADEPTGNLDSHNSAVVLDMLKKLNEKYRQTILMITHNAGVASYANRVVEMLDGRVIRESGQRVSGASDFRPPADERV